ncbi:MAG: polymer-forming cytoskeletal protein [Patescibacteria group bacterium]|nr:polymer-forming cytoskeletal protein [Patescibacteria group bacterium]
MAMFNGKDRVENQKGFEMKEGEIETIIGPSVKVEGDFKSQGHVLVQGILNGSLKTKGNLKVEEGAKIKANVEAANAVVKGEIAGNVTIKDSLQLGSSATIAGDIITKILSIEPGAVLNGHCSVSAAEAGEVSNEPAQVQKPKKES